MKILAFTDTHGSNKILSKVKSKAKRKKVDLAICCGDFTIFENDLKKNLKHLNAFKIPVILIHGNHETYSSIKNSIKDFKNIIYLHKNSHIYKKDENDIVEFFGYGGGGFSLKDEEFKSISKDFLKKAQKNKENNIKNVLIVHGPPYKTKLDDLGENNFCGNKDYRTFIVKAPISLTLAGHIHENFYSKDTINKKTVLNPGPQGTIIEI